MNRGVTRAVLAMMLMVSLSLWGVAGAQNLKIGYIDSMRIRVEFSEFAEAQEKFDKDVEVWQEKANEMAKEVEDLEKDLEAKSLLLSEEKKREKEQALQRKREEYQRFVADTFGPDGKAERKNAELTKPILAKINAALERIATEENYSYIFDAANGNIAYANKNLDLTDRLLEELSEGTD